MYIFTTLLFVAGILHFFAFSERYKVSRAIGWAYVIAGLAQIVLGVLFIENNYGKLLPISFALNLFFLLFWIIARIPSLNNILSKPEPLSVLVLVRKIIELAIVFLILF